MIAIDTFKSTSPNIHITLVIMQTHGEAKMLEEKYSFLSIAL